MEEKILNPQAEVAEVVPAEVEQHAEPVKAEEKKPVEMVTFEKTGWSCPKSDKQTVLMGEYVEDNASFTLLDKIKSGTTIVKDGVELINKKSLQDVVKYVFAEARKQAVNNCAMIADDEVYGWIIHYLEEESLEGTLFNKDGSKYEKKVEKKPEETKTTKSVSKKAEKKPEKKQAFKVCENTNDYIDIVMKWNNKTAEEKSFRLTEDKLFIEKLKEFYPDKYAEYMSEVFGAVKEVEEVAPQERPVETIEEVDDELLDIVDDDLLDISDDELLDIVDDEVVETEDEDWADDKKPIVPEQLNLWDM